MGSGSAGQEQEKVRSPAVDLNRLLMNNDDGGDDEDEKVLKLGLHNAFEEIREASLSASKGWLGKQYRDGPSHGRQPPSRKKND